MGKPVEIVAAAPEKRHNDLFQDLVEVLEKHSSLMQPLEVLAIIANVLGKSIALQDKRTVSVEEVLAVISANIEAGNAESLSMRRARTSTRSTPRARRTR
jgi:uncharacterized protein YejL (UPF0352 family)